MWIPHFGYYFWEPQSENRVIEASLADKNARRFYITFVLDQPARLHAEDSQVELKAQVVKRIDHEKGFIEVRFEPNEDGRIGRISCRLEAPSFVEAAKIAYNVIAPQLSLWAYGYQSPQSTYGMTAYDERHQARWICVPQMAAADPFALPESVAFDPRFWSILSLYREGMNSRSPYYRFFCFYKMLEAFFEHRELFRQADEIIQKAGLSLKRPRRRVTRDMLVFSLLLRKYPEYEGRTFGWVFERIRSNERLMVAHVFPEHAQAKMVNLDDYDLYNEFASLSNLVSLMAHQIIEDELNLWQELLRAGVVQMPPPPPTFPGNTSGGGQAQRRPNAET